MVLWALLLMRTPRLTDTQSPAGWRWLSWACLYFQAFCLMAASWEIEICPAC